METAIWKLLSLGPERCNQDEPGVAGSLKFVEHLPDERKRKEGIQVLVVPTVKKGIRGNCFGIPKGGDKVRNPVVETRGEEIDSRVAPNPPQSM
ncbi:hypothetical protein E2C01_077507 [Portunus trituberculatus]|uniref:Uncharacterized protein n=1 Tax=Portunus trituberculatus TaxID=210409 RepID=A0A5B7IKE6_PORTR|nr:hypothetical protein [Portunus trituberculatus]